VRPCLSNKKSGEANHRVGEDKFAKFITMKDSVIRILYINSSYKSITERLITQFLKIRQKLEKPLHIGGYPSSQ
jgi:hypothetical protein